MVSTKLMLASTPQLEATIQRKRRHSISDAERRMIRRRAASHLGKQQQIVEWFEQETGSLQALGTRP
jgi:Fission yeast centromere protein N-terminal domain